MNLAVGAASAAIRPGLKTLAFALALSAFSATAQTTEPDKRVIEEIIVSAEVVNKSMQDIPMAVSALDNTRLEDSGVVDIDDLMIFIPSISRDLLDLAIRGVGRNFRTLGGDPGVLAYFNGVLAVEAIYQGGENGYYDLERIEVLRGPQGTLFGRNAIGGVVNFISNRPTREFFAEFKTRAGDYDTSDVHGVISGPVIRDILNARLAVASLNQGSDRPSRAAPGQTPASDTGAFEDNNIALSLEITPTDNIEIHLRTLWRYLRVEPRAPVLLGEGTVGRTRRSSDVCFPVGTDCFSEPFADFFNRPPLNPSANVGLPVNGNGYGEDLDNVAYPDFKPDYGGRTNNSTAEVLWHFAQNQYTMRFLGGYFDVPWGTWVRHQDGAPSGRNTCNPPLCAPGDGEQLTTYKGIADNPGRVWSGELQLISNLDGPFNYVTGVYYLDLERELFLELADDAHLGYYTDNPSWGLLDPDLIAPPPRGPGRHNLPNDEFEFNYFGGTPNGAWFWMDTENHTRSFATYLQANYQISDSLDITAGLRWSEERRTGVEWRWIYNEFNAEFLGYASLADFNADITTDPVTGEYNGDPFRLNGFPTEIIDSLYISDSWDHLTWRLALRWKPSEQTMTYLSATKGARSGGFNLGLHQEFPYDEEEVMAYEVGLKTDLFDGRLRLNTNIYYYDYDNHQVSANAVLPGSVIGCNVGCVGDTTDTFLFFNAVQNAPKARNWGTELETWWQINPNFNLGLNHSYMDTEITDDFLVTRQSNPWSSFTSNEIINLKGAELTKAPRNRFTLWANYRIPLGEKGRINLLAIYAYTDEQYFDLVPDRINEAPSFQRWDFRATWDSARDKYRVSVYVKNIADELGIVAIRTGENFARIADTTKPRIWGLEFRMRFGTWSRGGVDFDGPNANR